MIIKLNEKEKTGVSEMRVSGVAFGNEKNVVVGLAGLDLAKFSQDVVERLEESREDFPKPEVSREELDRVKVQRRQAQEELASLQEAAKLGQGEYERALLSGDADLDALERRQSERAGRRAALETRLRWLESLERDREQDYLARVDQADKLWRDEFRVSMRNRLELLSARLVAALPYELLVEISAAFEGQK